MSDYDRDSNGYVYECGCGERYREATYAWSCRKCRDYLMPDDFYARKVVDIRTGAEVPR